MNNNLKQYFPMIRTREEVLEEINSSVLLADTYNSWSESYQREFIDICTGARGVKILYDSFFKEIMNPEYSPERMNDMLSVLLKRKVKIKEVLPLDSTRLGEESSLIIMDIVVELEDGSIADVEVQKVGYAFPGERMACYSADMLLRQYKRIRDTKKKKFTYKDIGKVYTIIFFEKSPKELRACEDTYIHMSKQKFDTELELNLLQEYILVALDIFEEIKQNESINNKLDAWLTFLSSDSPEQICNLIDAYPEYMDMYKEIYELCHNVEKVMGMFSKELLELDRNTEEYMIDEMQKEIDEKKKELAEQKKEINEQKKELDEINQKLNGIKTENEKLKKIVMEFESKYGSLKE